MPSAVEKQQLATIPNKGQINLPPKLIPRLAVVLFASVACVTAFAIETKFTSAHANQLRANPQPSQELEVAPERVIIWFTEPIEPAFSNISVLNSAGAEMTSGDTVVDPTEPQAMWRAVDPLPDDTYTVVWRNVSTIDGHRVVGSYLFAVGEELGAGANIDASAQPLLQSPADPFIRWTAYTAIAALVGGLIFEMFIVSNLLASPAAGAQAITLARRVSIRAARVILPLGGVLIIAQLAQLLQQATLLNNASELGIATWLTQLPEVAIGSNWGVNWSMKTAVAIVGVLLLLLAHRSRVAIADHGDEEDDAPSNLLATDSIFGALALAAGLAYLILVSLASHNAATPSDIRWIAIFGDAIHIIAASVWVGGLIYLLVAASTLFNVDDMGHTARFLGATALRFTPFAIVCAAALFASGILSTVMQVAVAEALMTPYGLVLITKTVLVVPLVGIAGYNMVSVSRRIGPSGNAYKTLRQTVTAEIAIAACALLAAGWLASLEPARQYAERNGIGIPNEASQREVIDGATIDVAIEPGTVGVNALTVTITDTDGAPFTSVEQVRARVRYLDGDFGEPYLPLDASGEGIWSSDQVQLGIGGAYQVEANIVRTDAFDSNIAFRFSARSTAFAVDQLRASFNDASLALGAVLAITGLALLATRAVGGPKRLLDLRRIVAKPGTFGYAGVATVIVGIIVAVNPWVFTIGAPADSLRNPWPPTQESVSTGSATYATACASCHGATGRGDGVAAAALNPPPSDLAVHVPLHTDTELFDFIANGIDGTAMVARAEELTPDEIWHIINYIRTIDE